MSMISCFLFGLCFLALYINIVFLYKANKRLPFFQMAVMGIVTTLCVGAVTAQILEIFSIKINLISMSISYFIIGILLFGFSFCKKRRQHFKIQKMDIYSIIIILVGFFLIFLLTFTSKIQLAYINSDPANHYRYALEVMNTGRISAMYFASLYNALIMELFQPFICQINLYKAFIIADSMANLLNILVLYVMISESVKKKFSQIILPFLCLIYFMGWPFYNYAIGGFVYFGWGVTLMAYTIWSLQKLQKEKDKFSKGLLCLQVGLGCYSVLICYLMFIPIILAVICVTFISSKRQKGKSIFNKKMFIVGICICTVGVACIIYIYTGYFSGNLQSILNALRAEGGIHRGLYNDFLYFAPLVIYGLTCKFRSREVDCIYITEGIILGFICFTFVICFFGGMSSYYYYKTYYPLWFFSWIICAEAIDRLFDENKVILGSLISTFLLAAIAGMVGVDNNSILKKRYLVPTEYMGDQTNIPFSIYGEIAEFLGKDKTYDDRNALLDMCVYIQNNYNTQEQNITVVAQPLYYIGEWFCDFTGGNSVRVYDEEDFIEAIESMYKTKGYCVIHQNSELYRDNKDLLEGFETIYDNGYYGLYRVVCD